MPLIWKSSNNSNILYGTSYILHICKHSTVKEYSKINLSEMRQSKNLNQQMHLCIICWTSKICHSFLFFLKILKRTINCDISERDSISARPFRLEYASQITCPFESLRFKKKGHALILCYSKMLRSVTIHCETSGIQLNANSNFIDSKTNS